METILNKLLEKGWRPNGKYDGPHKPFIRLYKDRIQGIQFYYNERRDGEYRLEKVFSLRDIVSINSGLWQFVCENRMYKEEAGGIYFNDERTKNVFYKIDQFDEEGDVIQTGDMEGDRFIHMSEPEYRLIESALKDESELEEFLLQNIKIEG